MKIESILRSLCTLCVAEIFVNCFAHQHSFHAPINQKGSLQLEAHGAYEFSSLDSKLKSKAGVLIPSTSFVNRLMFGWVKDMISLGNKKRLDLADLWILPKQMDNVSHVFDEHYKDAQETLKWRKEKSNDRLKDTTQKTTNIFAQFWASPLTKAAMKMYSKEFVVSGIFKFFNTLIQFVPSLIIARILKIAEMGADPSAISSGLYAAAQQQGILLTLMLLLSLCVKTFLENQYFDIVTTLGANIRGAISSAIYRKSLKLSPSGRQNNTVGEIVNYMQLDTSRMEYVASSIHIVWDGLFQVLGYTSLLLYFLGPSVLAGIAAMLVIIPLNAIFFKKFSALRSEVLSYTDARVKLTNEIMQGARAIKSYNWEKPFVAMLNSQRDLELRALIKSANVRAVLIAILGAAPSFVAVVTLSVYALLGNTLTPAKVFTALALFNQLRFPLIFLPMLLNTLAEGKVSLDRLDTFMGAAEVENYVEPLSSQKRPLQKTKEPSEILGGGDVDTKTVTNDHDETDEEKKKREQEDESSVLIEAGQFSWAAPASDATHNSSRDGRGSLVGVNVNIKKGSLVAVVGPVGSGKSTLLNALLGDLHKASGRVAVRGRVAYVPQSAWIPNDSLRNVVLFGRPLNWERYKEALRTCGLQQDLRMLDAGDATEIGERGANLSGGQKQRLSLARAVYDDADVYLLDDPLSALDSEVGSRVFRECITNSLKDKTRILVTHQLGLLPEADSIIIMSSNADDGSCRVLDQGTLAELRERGHDLAKMVKPPEEDDDRDTDLVSDIPPALPIAEVVASNVDGGPLNGLVNGTMVEQSEPVPMLLSESPVPVPVPVAVVTATVLPPVNHTPSSPNSTNALETEIPAIPVDADGMCIVAPMVPLASQTAVEDPLIAPSMPTAEPAQPSIDTSAMANPTPSHATSRETVPSPTTTALPVAPSLHAPVAASATAVEWRTQAVSESKETGGGGGQEKQEEGELARDRPAAKLMTVEERGEGAVSLGVYSAYMKAAKQPVMMMLVLISFFVSNTSQLLQQWVVGAWTSDVGYVKRPLAIYLMANAATAMFVGLFTWSRTYLGCLVGAVASKTLHNNMASKVLRAPLSFFESTPTGRLVQRFSKDLDQIDQQLPSSFVQLVASTVNIAGALFAITLVTPSFVVAMAPILFVYFRLTNYYRGVARELKRLESLSRSPIYAQFSETLGGLSVIRSFKREKLFQRSNEVKLDDNISAYFSLKAVDRWLSVRLELLGNSIVFFAALLAIMTGSRAGSAGISLTNALSITSLLNWAVRNGAEAESLMTSVERVLYTTNNTPQEKATYIDEIDSSAFHSASVAAASSSSGGSLSVGSKRTTDKLGSAPIAVTDSSSVEPLAVSPYALPSKEETNELLPVSDRDLVCSGWPWRGGIVFKDVVMRYREDFDPVLKGISLAVRPGESVGIVGRTGSGKSTLFRALLRLNELESGKVSIDGADISAVGLDALRSGISIIPQDPVLFSGTIRMNLDPFNTTTDEELWDALQKSNAAGVVAGLPGGLSFVVSEGGDNFSSGQRQLLCLTRALVRRSRLLLLDEATSSVDYDTDALIQKTIRTEFGGGKCTILTIAHRLDSIADCDRILVMDAGVVGEFDKPRKLLKNPKSLYSQLLAAEKESNSREKSQRGDVAVVVEQANSSKGAAVEV